MAYAAVISLKETIVRLACDQSWIFQSSAELLHPAFEAVLSLQEVLERLDSSSSINIERLNDLDGDIRDAVNNLEDLLEFHELNSSEIHGDGGCSSEEVLQITEGLKKMEEEYIAELDCSSPEDGNRMKSNTADIHLFDSFNLTKIGDPHSQKSYHEFNVFALIGRAGTGRSILARSVFYDPDIRGYFTRCAWVTVGPKYTVVNIYEAIESQLNLKRSSSSGGSKCLIVLDDVHDIQICESVRRSFLSEGDRMLVTTCQRKVARSPVVSAFNIYTMSILNQEQSWELLLGLVFDKHHQMCPRELEETGKMIAENCRGLSLEIVKAAFLLSKVEKTQQIWKYVVAATEEEKRNALAAERGRSVDGVEYAYNVMTEIYEVTKDLELNVGDEKELFSIIIKVLGLSYAIDYIKMNLFPIQPNLELEVISLFGMAGIGKTTCAKKIFDDSASYFDHRVWITLGPKYRPERILEDILGQIDPDIDRMRENGVEILCGKKCLIVLDDIWSKSPLCCLNSLFPGVKFEIWLTTRLKEVAQIAQSCYEIPFLNKEESWILLCEQVFGENRCPPELEKAGKLIAENCDGLPLMIVTVASFLVDASLLVEAEKIEDYWNKVAKKENSVFEQAHDKILEVLYPSYHYLPQHLKPCFLFMGIFPQNYEVSASKLFVLWNYDRILEPKWSKAIEHDGKEYLEELASRSLLVVGNKNYSSNIKTCRLHSVFLYLCVKEARKNKFFHVLNKCVDCLAENMKSQRRLCIQNNVLFGIKATHDSMASVSTARSLLCTGQLHEYPVPICLGLRLLKVLEGLSIRQYEFPIEVLYLINLRSLALTYDGKLPPSISKLKNLECLIVSRHLCTILYGAPLYLPVEIWDMKKLKHLQVMDGILPEPCGAVLPNLLVLLDVSVQSCTESVLRGTRNLQKLGIRIQLVPDASKTLFSFNHISHLDRLESVKFNVMNPELRFEVIPPPTPFSMSTSGLIKLSLSGIGYPWEYMNEIALIPFLEVLKLRCYAFRGPRWQMHGGEFRSLRYLLLEDSDLVHWRVVDSCFPLLEHLMIRHCYKLEAIPAKILGGSCRIELIDCNLRASLYPAMQENENMQCSWPTMQEKLILESSQPTTHENKNLESLLPAMQQTTKVWKAHVRKCRILKTQKVHA